MRIVRLANFVAPHSGGLRTSLAELGAGYLAAGHEPVLVIPGERDGDELTTQGRVITLRAPRLPFTGGYRVLWRRRRLARLLAALRPDALEVSDRTTLRWTGAWAREHGVPAVMVSHESVTAMLKLTRGPAGPKTALSRAIADWLNRRTARAYHRVICTTGWAAAEFERIGAGNLVRVPLGVDLDTFSPRAGQVRARYVGEGQILLVHCGRLSAEKRPQRSLTTLATLRAAGMPVRLVVAGEGPLRARLARRAARAGLPVTFAGFLPGRADLAALLASADVAIAPGPAETFGLAALEALACGTPVVVSAESALPEVVGEAGASVPGEDLAAGVRAMLARPERARRAAARACAEQYDWGTATRGFLAAHVAAGGPGVVVGINDTLRGDFDPERTGVSVGRTVAALRAAGAEVLTMRLPDPGQMFGLPGALARPLARRMRAVNAVVDEVARRHRTVHLDAACDPATYERRYWSVDRLHPNERGHRLIACRFHALLAGSGFPVGPGPDPEPSSPPPSRLAEVGWMATKGTAWLVRRSRDLVPALMGLALREWLGIGDEEQERHGADPEPINLNVLSKPSENLQLHERVASAHLKVRNRFSKRNEKT